MKRYIVYPTDRVPFTSIVRFYGVRADECVNARRRDEIAGLDVSRLIPLRPDNRRTDSRACKCGGIDTDGDGDCHLCYKREMGGAR